MNEPSQSIARYDQARREARRRSFRDNPDALPEAIARHYASLAQTAMAMLKICEARRYAGGAADETVAMLQQTIARAHLDDFGIEPSWLPAP